jgi:predicted membrane-bound spermidine synthase
MAGLGFGALFGGILVERVKRKIRLYFLIEVAIGILGLASLYFIDFIGQKTAGSQLVLAALYKFLILFIPTFLMGTTLPILTKIFDSLIRNFLKTVSHLYFINTIGAACGTLIASYWLVSFFGLDRAVLVAVLINFILALMIYVIPESLAKHQPRNSQVILETGNLKPVYAYLCVFITGFIAIGYEIVWFRINSVLVKASPYAFSSVLAVYLFGIALGSYLMNKRLRHVEIAKRKELFFLIQFLIGVFASTSVLLFYYGDQTLLGDLSRFSFNLTLHPSLPVSGDTFFANVLGLISVFLWPIYFMLIPTLLMGASFPLLSSLALSDPGRQGQTVGRVYFFNVLGNVSGGVATGFILLPYAGTERTLLLFALCAIGFGLLVKRFPFNVPVTSRLFTMLILAGFLTALFPAPLELYKKMHVSPWQGGQTFFEEGREGVIATFKKGQNVANYINGLEHGGRISPVFYYQALEAMSYAESVDHVLVIGYGTGSFVEMVLKDPTVKKVTLVEINSTLIRNLKKMDLFQRLLSDPRIEIVFDDGRRYLYTHNDMFDLILIDPLRSTTAYSNNLYSLDFFNLAARHLKPNGVFLTYIDEEKALPKTLTTAFSNVRFYQRFGLASNQQMHLNEKRKNFLLGTFLPREMMMLTSVDRFVGNENLVSKLDPKIPINTDKRPASEYYLGLHF